MEAIFLILKTIYQKIGIAGCLVIALSGWIAIDHVRIKHDETTIVGLNADIKIQNTAIKKAGEQFKALQSTFQYAVDANDILTKDFDTYKQFFNDQPIATTCNAAIEEIRVQASKTAAIWNVRELNQFRSNLK